MKNYIKNHDVYLILYRNVIFFLHNSCSLQESRLIYQYNHIRLLRNYLIVIKKYQK